MKTKSIEIKIPAGIVALPISLSEKVVLEHIRQFPGCSNARLAELLGISGRGVENMLRRLRSQGYIEQVGKGRARRHRLKFKMEAGQEHTLCGNNNNDHSCAESHTSRGEKRKCQPIQIRRQPSTPKRELSREEDFEHTR